MLNGNEFNLQSAFSIAMHNAALDLRVITACYILLKPNLNGNEQIRKYITALLSGALIHPTGAISGRTKSISRASDILGVYIRHRDYPNYGDGSYGSWLSTVLEYFGRVNEKRRVSGRIYSGWGRNDPHSMNNAYIQIAISFSNKQWQLEPKWFDIIFSDLFRYQDQKALIRDLQDWVKLSDEIKEPFLMSKEQFDANIDNFKASIEKIITQITERQNEIVAKAKIDEDLLTKFGLVCSGAFLSEDNNLDFPINLFKSTDFNGQPSDINLKKIRIVKYSKENIAKNVDANRAINEETWLKQSVKQDSEVNILREILWYKTSESRVYPDVENNIIDISTFGKDIISPILFSGSSELNRLLREASYKQELANKFNISFVDGYGRDYICHIGNIIVYGIHFSDVNFSLLTTKDIFDSIEFGKVTEEQFVKVTYEPSDNENIGTLLISYWMNVALAQGKPCIKTEVKTTNEE